MVKLRQYNKSMTTLDLSLAKANGDKPYLGDREVIFAMTVDMATLANELLVKASAVEIGFDDMAKQELVKARELAGIFLGRRPEEFTPVEGWNVPGVIDRFVAAQANIDEADPEDCLALLFMFVAKDAHEAAHMADQGAPDEEWQAKLDNTCNDATLLLMGVPQNEPEAEGLPE